MKPAPQTHTLIWEGIELEIRYIKSWSASFEKTYGHAMAHLEIRTITDTHQALPITETGYRSHFIAADEIEALGGPVGYVQAWLDEAAKDPVWKNSATASGQMALF